VVLDEAGAPVAGVPVHVSPQEKRRDWFAPPSGRPAASSDADGRFVAWAPGSHEWVEAGAVDGWVGGEPVWAGDDEAPLRLQVARARRLRGVALGPEGDVLLHRSLFAQWPGAPEHVLARPDAEGRFDFRVPRSAARVRLVAFADGQSTTSLPETFVDLDLAGDADVEFTVRVPAASYVSGTVVGEDGRPAAGALVDARRADGPQVTGLRAEAGPDGSFRVGPLAAADYWLHVLPRAHAGPPPRRVRAPADGVRVVCPVGHVLRGRVLLPAGVEPVVHLTWGRAEDLPREAGRGVQVGPDGKFQFVRVSEDVRLHVRVPGHGYAVVERPRFDEDLEIRLVRGESLGGRVRGRALEDATVEVFDGVRRFEESVGDGGTFRLEDLPPGRYRVALRRAFVEPWRRADPAVVLAEGVATGTTDLVLTAPD
jgi:hypothetical protein